VTPPAAAASVTPFNMFGTRVVKVAPPMDLQAALSAAKSGDEFRLTSASTFIGAFTLPVLCGVSPVTITSDIDLDALVAPGKRMTPTKAATLAKIVSTGVPAALNIDGPSCNVIVKGVEIAFAPPAGFASINYGLVLLGDGGWAGGGETQTTLARVPRNIVIDRSYIHGSATGELVRCVALNSANTQVLNSWISECHTSGFDAQAIEGWNGPGPYLIDNNYVAGSGENIMFGGADPGIVDLRPCNITITRNHFEKPPEWKGKWSVKNLLELKSACNVVIEGNVFRRTWPASQEGMAIVLKSSVGGGTVLNEGTTDVAFRYNIVDSAAVGFNLQAVDCSGQACATIHMARVRVEHNLITNVGATINGNGRSALMLLTHDYANVAFVHNTMLHAPGASGLTMALAYSAGAARNVRWEDNVFTATAGYMVHADMGQLHAAGITTMIGDRSWAFKRNVVGGLDPQYLSQQPAASWYPSTVAGIGLAADFSLLPTSPYKGKGLGGTDPGADIAELTRRTAGVVVAP
jgi:hypothetical protein